MPKSRILLTIYEVERKHRERGAQNCEQKYDEKSYCPAILAWPDEIAILKLDKSDIR